MENAKAFPFVTLAARVVVSTVACHTGGRERAGRSLDGGWDSSLVNVPRSAEKKFMDLLKQVKKVYVPPMHFTLLETKQSRSSASGCNMNRTAAPGVQDARRRDRGSSSCRVRGCKREHFRK